MKSVKVLGTGCAKCKQLYQLIADYKAKHQFDFELEKVEDIMDIMAYDVMGTPALVIDEKPSFVGLPSKQELAKLLNAN
ncbi:thioredoxin family protein [Saprospira grandis]|uniref:thioredoxin family protein n=1 Tax=Saprospira grandis TaxID=1008 RepID=UPI0022DD5CFA|nr:thioredoxin family protein [Saprospira grandis]WBM75711.1 thioredoxin family protein [Saprospira grandis]